MTNKLSKMIDNIEERYHLLKIKPNVEIILHDSLWDSIYASFRASIYASFRASIYASLNNLLRNSLYHSLRYSLLSSLSGSLEQDIKKEGDYYERYL